MLHSELQDMEVVCVQNAKSDYMKYEVLESASCAGDNTDSNIHVVIQNDCQGTDFQCTPKSEKIVDIEHNHTPVLNTSETSCEIIAENNRLEYDKSEVDGELEFSQNCEVVNDRNSEKCPEDRLPDGGWGWVVVFGASLILVLVDTIGQCFGIIFSSFLLDLETPTAVTAWIFNIFSFTWCMTGPPLGPLITEYGWRSLSFIGSFLLATATVTSAFVSAAWVLFFTHSLLAGVGCGIISNISYMIVPHYFKKRRGLANGIIMAFDCGGQFFGPPLIDFLQQEYTFKGATLILSGVILNCCVGAAVFQPVEWHLKPQAPKILKTEEREALIRKECGTQPAGSSENLARKLLRILKSTVADLVILKSARAMIISVAATVIFTGYLNFLAIVPFAMRENGFTLKDSAMCVSVSAICNMITRVIVASLSDTKWFNYRISMMIGSLTISGTMVCFTFLQDLTWMKVTMGLWGCGVGTFMNIFNLVMVHYMGLDNLMQMLGASMLCIAIGYLTIGPFAGYIRDETDSYAVCIWVLAGVVFSSFLLWLFMPAAVAYDSRHSKNQNQNKT